MGQTLRSAAFLVAALTMLALCYPVSAASPNQRKPLPVWQDVEQVSVQPECLYDISGVYDGIPEECTLTIADRAMARRLLSGLRQNHRLSYADNQIKPQGAVPEPPMLVIALRIHGFTRNWWTLQLRKKHGDYPVQFEHNAEANNKLQLSYTTVSASQLRTFLRLLRTASGRAHHQQKGYTFVPIQET